jgi:hypothetical protein
MPQYLIAIHHPDDFDPSHDAGLTGRCRGAASRVSIPASKWAYLSHRKPGTPVN